MIDHDVFEVVPTERRAFAQLLWQHIPANGKPIGNVALRSRSRTTSSRDYWEVRNTMVAAGLIVLRYGRGGSVRRSEAYVTTTEPEVAPTKSGLELSLCDSIAERLVTVVKDENRF